MLRHPRNHLLRLAVLILIIPTSAARAVPDISLKPDDSPPLRFAAEEIRRAGPESNIRVNLEIVPGGAAQSYEIERGASGVIRVVGADPAGAMYGGLDALWNARADTLNLRLRERKLPVQVANLSSIWTVIYTEPARYNWMLQFYLRAEGLALSWIGTGRLIFSLNYTDADFAAVADRFVAAAEAMRRDGFWWHDPAATNKSIKRRVLREVLAHRFGRRTERTA